MSLCDDRNNVMLMCIKAALSSNIQQYRFAPKPECGNNQNLPCDELFDDGYYTTDAFSEPNLVFRPKKLYE